MRIKNFKDNISKVLMSGLIFFLFAITACGGGGDDGGDDDSDAGSYTVTATPEYSRIKLSWETLEGSYNAYEILRSKDNGDLETLESYNYSNTYVDSAVEQGITYKYKIKSKNSSSETLLSDPVSVLSLEIPSGITVEKSGFTGIDISFNVIPANKEMDMNYEIERSEDNATFAKIITFDNRIYNYIQNQKLTSKDSSIDPDKTYYYRIVSRIRNKTSFFSTSESKEGRISRPAAPGNLAADTASGIKLTWDIVADVAGYKIYRSEDNITYTLINTSASSTYLTYTDTTIGPGIDYYYKITSYSGSNESDQSDEVSGEIELANFIPVKPIATLNKSTLVIKWNTVPGIDSYRLYRSTTETGTYTQVGSDLASSATSVTDNPPSMDTPYYYKISVIKGVNESLNSNAAKGAKVKYEPDLYEENDSPFGPKTTINLSYSSVTQTHTLDWDDSWAGGGDYFVVYNKSYLAKKVKVTFTSIDFNGNTKILFMSGNTVNITAVGDSVTSSSTLNVNQGWTFNLSREWNEHKTAQYTIKVELVTP
jgi:hypothetical protein